MMRQIINQYNTMMIQVLGILCLLALILVSITKLYPCVIHD